MDSYGTSTTPSSEIFTSLQSFEQAITAVTEGLFKSTNQTVGDRGEETFRNESNIKASMASIVTSTVAAAISDNTNDDGDVLSAMNISNQTLR